MPKPIALKVVIKILVKYGFKLISQKGSHAKYRKITKSGTKKTVIVKTTKKEIPYGTFQSILIQSGLEGNDFNS